MAEEEAQEAVTEDTSAEEPEEAPQEASEEDGERPDGTKYVKFSTPEEEARFKRVYAHMKLNERALEELGKTNRMLADRVSEMETQHQRIWSTATTEGLRKAKVAALENGDYDKVAQIDEKLVELRQQPAKQDAPQQAGLDQSTERALIDWMYETGSDGSYLRPWAEEGHPDYDKCLLTASKVLNDPSLANMPFEEKLKTIDRHMQPSKSVKPAVLTGDTKRPSKSNTPKMTPEEVRAAEAMGYTPDDYVKLYKKWSRANA